jgi:PKD repeat protein
MAPRHNPPRSILVAFLLILLLVPFGTAWSADAFAPRPFAPVQEGFTDQVDTVLPYHPQRILVQLTSQAFEDSDLHFSLEKGAVAPSARTGLASLDALCATAGVKAISRPYIQVRNQDKANELGLERWYLLETDGSADVRAMSERMGRDRNVQAATVDWRAFPAAVPSDPLYDDHWGHNNTSQMISYDWSVHDHVGPTVGTVGFDANAQAAWDQAQGYGSTSVVIAIIDSGVEVGHPDLTQVTGYDYGDNDSNPDDNSSQPGHGTACAGVAAAKVNNGLGATGVAPNCKIMPLKVANSAGSMYFSSIQNALYYAADNGADIASMSLGAAISSDSATDSALQYAYNAGVTLLAATGNENASTISYPAINQYVIAVGAASPCGDRKRSSSSSSEVNTGVNTDPNGYTCDGERWWGSNYGLNSQDSNAAVDVIAPTILPTTDLLGSAGYDSSDYSMWFNGTSCATPYAAGVCALIKSAYPAYTPAQIRDRLTTTAADVTSVESGSGWDRYTGYGMVDAAAAVGGGGGGGTAPVAAFSGTPTSGDTPLTVSFSDASSNSPTSWSWTFGDGGTSTSANPSHTYYSAGTYTVALTASNAYGTDSETKTSYITVTDPPVGGTHATLPYTTGFEGGALDQYWTSTSNNTGRLQVTTANTPHGGSYHLTMDCSSNGTYSTNQAWLYLDLSGQSQVDLNFWWKDFSDETHSTDGVYLSNNDGVSFVKVLDLNGASYTNNVWREWDVDIDEVAAANGLTLNSTFVIKFQQYDNYQMTTDGMAFDDISVTAGPAGFPPVAAFSGTPTSGDYPLAVSFTDASTEVPTGWSWSFGDGATSTAQNPSHTYTAAGNYTVSLTASNAFGSDTETKTSYITVTEPPVGGGDYATVPYSTGFESGDLDGFWTTASTNNGRVRVISTYTPHGGGYQLAMDCSSNGTYSYNEAWLHLDLSGETDVNLNFWWKEFGDETHTGDGVYFSSDDGASFVKVQNLNGQSYSNQTWTSFTLDVDALAGANGLSLSSTFIVKFQQYDNYGMTSDGFTFDDIEVTAGSGGGGGGSAITAETEPNANISQANGPVGDGVAVSGTISSSSDDDYFWFDVDTAGNINISVAIAGSADLDWYLYNSSGTQVDRGYTVSNPEAGSYNASVGRYYVRVDGYNGATSGYTLTVDGGLAPLTEAPEKGDTPLTFSLRPNAPNPFNPATTIAYDLPRTSQVLLRIYDTRGRLVRTLVNETVAAGRQTVVWNGTDEFGARVHSGVYFYLIEAEDFRATRKMTLLK